MDNPIVEKILKEGINSVNISMLDEKQRRKIMIDAGEKLFKQSRYIEAIDIMVKADNMEWLMQKGDDFMNENKTELATLFYLPTKDKQKLNNAAILCIKLKNYKLASAAYEAADNRQMSEFIKANFC